MSEREKAYLSPSLHWLREAKSNQVLELGGYTIIEPTLGRVVLRMLEDSNVTSAGLFLPGAGGESTHVGVVEVTCDAYESAPDDTDASKAGPIFSVGDVVIISKYTGSEITFGSGLNRKKRIVCYESDIIARLRQSNAGRTDADGDRAATDERNEVQTAPKLSLH